MGFCCLPVAALTPSAAASSSVASRPKRAPARQPFCQEFLKNGSIEVQRSVAGIVAAKSLSGKRVHFYAMWTVIMPPPAINQLGYD